MRKVILTIIAALIVLAGCRQDSVDPIPPHVEATVGSVQILNPATNMVEKTISFTDNLFGGATSIVADGSNNIYVLGITSGSYFGGPVHKINVVTGATTRNYYAGTFYAMGYSQTAHELYLADVKNLQTDGAISILDDNGVLKKAFPVQLGPGAFAFQDSADVLKGVYILNEGNFGDASGARLTYYDRGRDSVFHNVYESANGGQHLGSLGDDITSAGGKLFVAMSGSQEIHILDRTDFHNILTTTFTQTVHDLAVDTIRHRVYVSMLFSDTVAVLEENTLQVDHFIHVGHNPQGLLIVGNHLYVCNSGYGADSTLSVINLDTFAVDATITVGKGPTYATRTTDGRIAVLCTGSSAMLASQASRRGYGGSR